MMSLFCTATDPQQVPPVAHCTHCLGEIYPGERTYRWEQREICPDCLRAILVRWAVRDLDDLAATLGVDRFHYPDQRCGRGGYH